jgi:antitoxin PrlF
MTTKGQVTIPKQAREFLKIGPGDKVRFFTHPAGYIMLLPKVPVSKARGIIQYTGPTRTIEEMDQGVREGVAQEFRRAASRR